MFSLILPVYNEKESLSRNIGAVMRELKRASPDFEIIIAEDGSTDGSLELARRLSRENRNIIVSHSDKRIGKGLAIKRAFSLSSGKRVGYLDIDLSADLSSLGELVRLLDTHDIVIGSRFLGAASVKRKPIRLLLSVAFNLIARLLFRTGIRDHQCGFKSFRREALEDALEKTRSNGWFFDTEVLVNARRMGLSIRELPVHWRESERSKVKLKQTVIRISREMLAFMRNKG